MKQSGEHGSKPRSQIRLLYWQETRQRGHLRDSSGETVSRNRERVKRKEETGEDPLYPSPGWPGRPHVLVAHGQPSDEDGDGGGKRHDGHKRLPPASPLAWVWAPCGARHDAGSRPAVTSPIPARPSIIPTGLTAGVACASNAPSSMGVLLSQTDVPGGAPLGIGVAMITGVKADTQSPRPWPSTLGVLFMAFFSSACTCTDLVVLRDHRLVVPWPWASVSLDDGPLRRGEFSFPSHTR